MKQNEHEPRNDEERIGGAEEAVLVGQLKSAESDAEQISGVGLSFRTDNQIAPVDVAKTRVSQDRLGKRA